MEGSTVSLQDKAPFPLSTSFIALPFESFPTFSKSFPFSFSVIPAKAGISQGRQRSIRLVPWLLCLERGTPAFAGVTDVMKAAGVTWSNEGLSNALLNDQPNYK